jgi:hypothetical protein
MSPRAAVVVDEGVDGLGAIVGDLISTNVEDSGRWPLLGGRPWSVAIDVHDAESTFFVSVDDGRIRVGAGRPLRMDLEVRVDGDTLIGIPEIPLVAGVPDPRSPAARRLFRDLGTGRVSIGGIARHPLLLRRFLRILTTAQATSRRSRIV